MPRNLLHTLPQAGSKYLLRDYLHRLVPMTPSYESHTNPKVIRTLKYRLNLPKKWDSNSESHWRAHLAHDNPDLSQAVVKCARGTTAAPSETHHLAVCSIKSRMDLPDDALPTIHRLHRISVLMVGQLTTHYVRMGIWTLQPRHRQVQARGVLQRYTRRKHRGRR